jgi:hypothetical protein
VGERPNGLQQRLEVLQLLVSRNEALEPWPDADAIGGHAWREADEILGLPLGGAQEVLEELAGLGLLERELFNRIHLCPCCSSCRINFRETCPDCASIALQTDGLIHHFACAHCGLESDFERGRDLVCPKCKQVLGRLGLDFERPHETYVCRKGGHLFEEPRIEGQCLDCEHVAEAADLVLRDVHRYRATDRAFRALELGRISRLDVEEAACSGQYRLATPGQLALEVERELSSLIVRERSFMTLSLRFEVDGDCYPLLSEWSTESQDELIRLFLTYLRGVDMVAMVDPGTLVILLAGGNEDRFELTLYRIKQALEEQECLTIDGRALQVVRSAVRWSDPSVSTRDVMVRVGAAT